MSYPLTVCGIVRLEELDREHPKHADQDRGKQVRRANLRVIVPQLHVLDCTRGCRRMDFHVEQHEGADTKRWS